MNNVKLVNIPFTSHFNLSSGLCRSSEEEKDCMSHVPYANVVGSLMYVMVCSRPDISHATCVVTRYMENPGREHWNAVKCMLRYLRGTRDYCITFNDSSGYVDSDFAGDLDKRRSTSGYVFTLAGGSISRMSKLQETVSLSNIEVEYIVAS